MIPSDDFEEDSIPTTLFDEEPSRSMAGMPPRLDGPENGASSASVSFSDDFEQELVTLLRPESNAASNDGEGDGAIVVSDDFEEHILTRLADADDEPGETDAAGASRTSGPGSAEHTEMLGDDELDDLAVSSPSELGDDPSARSKGAARVLGLEFGGFRIVRKIAEGGMASVYLARKEGPRAFNQHAAVKIVHPHFESQQAFIGMFLDEARIAALVQHPNVCRVLDFGHANGTYYLAMEYVHGEPWGELLNALLEHPEGRQQLPVIAAHVLAQACEGLHAAHEATDENDRPLHIVHRDISPHNIFVAYDGTVRVLDFGVASAADRLTTTRTGTVKGRLSYMAPEQMRAEPVDPRADVWSLGVVLREALEGKRLFRRGSEAETMLAVASDPLPEWQKGVTGALKAVADQALERDRDARFASARDMGRALSRYVGGQMRPLDSAELSAWLTRLFGERIERKKRWLKEPIPEPVASEASASEAPVAAGSDSGLLQQSERTPSLSIEPDQVAAPMPAAVRQVVHDPTLKLKAASAPRRVPALAWVSLALALAAVLGVAGATYLRHRQQEHAEGPPFTPARQLVPAVEAPPAEQPSRPHVEPIEPPAGGREAKPEAAAPGEGRSPGEPASAAPAAQTADGRGEAVPSGDRRWVRKAQDVRARRRARAARNASRERAGERREQTQGGPDPSSGAEAPSGPGAAAESGPPGWVVVALQGGWADVFVNDRKLGTTPGRFELPSGLQTIVLKPFGAGPALRERVEVPAGGSVKLRVEL